MVDETSLRDMLSRVAAGQTSIEAALTQLRNSPYEVESLGFATIDHHRALRQGRAEAVYAPGKTPTGTPPEGAIEIALGDTTIVNQAQITAAAQKALYLAEEYRSEISARLAAGRWTGPSDLWLGDYAQVTMMRFGILFQTVARVTHMAIALDDSGVPDVTVTLNRAPVVYQQGKKDARIYLR